MAVETKAKRPSLWRRYVRNRQLLLMMVPALAFFIVFHYEPMYGAIIAFKDFRITQGIFGSDWTGWDNFAKLFSSDDFPRALRNTVIISLLRLTFGFFAPIILALLLNEVRIAWYKRTVQTLTYLPYFLSWVILGGIFKMLFSNSGPLNGIITSLGGDPVDFLSSNGWFIFVLIVTGIWQSVGYGAVIYLAALAGIDPQLYEAAMIDGAGRWKQTLHITLPCLVPTIITLFILNVGHILNAGFYQIYNMYNPLVYQWSDIIDTYVLRRLTTMDFSLATAAGLFKSVVGLMMVVLVNSFARRASGGEYGIW
jgi:putative aldouronate transport system permease protein